MPNGPSKKERRPALGRGLSSLIQGSTTTTVAPGAPAGRRILDVAIEQLRPHTAQPRRQFRDETLDELAASVKAHGVLSPILARKVDRGYEIIAGERRWRAAQRAGLREVPVVVETADDGEAFEIALVENIQREDLNPIEEAEAYARLMELRGLTQAQAAQMVGKDRSTVANAIRLLKLPDGAREAVVDGRLSMGHARALVALDGDEAIGRATREVLAAGLSVRQTEGLIRRLKQGGKRPAAAAAKPAPSAAVRDLVDRLQQALGTRVSLKTRGRRGQLLVDYASLDELDRIVDRILGER